MLILTSTTSYDYPRASIYGLLILNALDSLIGHANPTYPRTEAASLITLSPPLAASLTLRYELQMGITTMCL
jgi:hypothetical protein